jgi:predicted nucleotide-binding protein
MDFAYLLVVANEETRQAALGKTNFDTPTPNDIELDLQTKVYLGDKQVAPTEANEVASTPANNKVFLVHGHDHGARETVARFIEKLGLDPIILDEQASTGRTIIEKLEGHSDVGFAVVLMTHDDEGRSLQEKAASPRGKPNPRARQNVILEMGYFMAHLGRDKVCGLTKGNIEKPSDLSGVVVISLDLADWKNRLAKEFEAVGFAVNWAGANLVRQ